MRKQKLVIKPAPWLISHPIRLKRINEKIRTSKMLHDGELNVNGQVYEVKKGMLVVIKYDDDTQSYSVSANGRMLSPIVK